MKFQTEHFFCSPRFLTSVEEIREIQSCVAKVKWEPEFAIEIDGKKLEHQTAYNKAFEIEFTSYGWTLQPRLCDEADFTGDFQKNDVFIEVQFGNSASIYRDYYKFHYGLTHRLLSLAVLIVPTEPKKFFPTRPASVSNMAEFGLARRAYGLLPIPVPILLIGLLPEN